MKLEDAINYEALYDSFVECKRGKLWKDSVIEFNANYSARILTMIERMMNDEYIFSPFYETIIHERGKERLIRSQCIQDRVIHKSINQHIIKPTFEKSYIYDNSASQKGKGIDFALKRIKCHLNRAYRKWGNDFYILQMDIRKYFDSVPHDYIKELFNKIEDENARNLCCKLLDSYGDIGMGLGSEICQSLALLTLNDMDHFIKEELKIKEYGRYMDDCYLIHPDKEFLQYCLSRIENYLNSIGLELNQKKTQIFPIKNGFTILGFNHRMTSTGHVIAKTKNKTITRAKRKMRKLRKKIDEDTLNYADAYSHLMSVVGHVGRGNCYNQLRSIKEYYNNVFIRR